MSIQYDTVDWDRPIGTFYAPEAHSGAMQLSIMCELWLFGLDMCSGCEYMDRGTPAADRCDCPCHWDS